jgi:hypothetical protein
LVGPVEFGEKLESPKAIAFGVITGGHLFEINKRAEDWQVPVFQGIHFASGNSLDYGVRRLSQLD